MKCKKKYMVCLMLGFTILSIPGFASDPEINVAYEISPGNPIDALCSPFPYHLGSTKIGSATAWTLTMHIANASGTANPLLLTGPIDAPVEIRDNTSGKFSISTQPPSSSIAQGSSVDFVLRFDATAPSTSAGLYSCTICIMNNDPDEGEYLIPVTVRVTTSDGPEMILRQGSRYVSQGIGSALPLLGSFNFGARMMSSPLPLTRDFSIENAGTADMIISGVTYTGAGALSFSGSCSGTIPPKGTPVGLTISYKKTNAAEDVSPYASIATNDTDLTSSAYQFHTRAQTIDGSAAPRINLVQGFASIPFATANAPHDLEFGSVRAQRSRSYLCTIQNLGTSDLTFDSTPPSVTNPAFVISGLETAALTPGSSSTFVLTFAPTSATAPEATVTLYTNAPDYSFTVSGTGITAPEIDVKNDSATPQSIPSGTGPHSIVDFGNVQIDDSNSRTFRIWNLAPPANASLNLASTRSDRVKVIDSTSHFSVVNADQPADPFAISAGGNRPFTITFSSTALGQFETRVEIENNDPDGSEAPYTFIVRANCIDYTPAAQIQDPGLTHKPTNQPYTHYGLAPLRVQLVPANVSANAKKLKWDLDGIADNGPSGDGFEVTDDFAASSTAPATQTVTFQTPALTTIRLKAIDVHGDESGVDSITVGAYPNEKVTFPWITGLPFDYEPPWIDGILSGSDGRLDPSEPPVDYGENGWQNSYSIPYGDGTDPHVRVDLVRHAADLYLAFDIDFDEALTANDVIMVGIGINDQARFTDTDNATALLKLHPLTEVVEVSTKNASGAWQSFATTTEVEFKVDDKTGIDGRRWSGELKLPTGTAGVPWLALGSNFLLFVDFYRTESSTPTYVRFTWPRTIPGVSAIEDVNSPQLDPVWWGLAVNDGSLTSNGIKLNDYSSIGTQEDSVLTSDIHYTDPAQGPNQATNTLVANVSNDAWKETRDSSGNLVKTMLDAKQVRVRFKIANWGITNLWDDVFLDPAIPENTVNPTAYADVLRGSNTGGVITPYTQPFTVKWKLSPGQIDQFTADEIAPNGLAVSHQCMRAEIEMGQDTSPEGAVAPEDAVNVVRRTVWRNMDFSPANAHEAFSRRALISGKGLEAFLTEVKAKSDKRDILLRLYTSDWKTSERTVSALENQRVMIEKASLESSGGKKPAPKPTIKVPPYLKELRSYIKEAPSTISFTKYIVQAYVYTGRTVRNGSQTFQEVASIGSYGYVVRHLGSVEDWDCSIDIDGLEKIDDTTYILHVRKDEMAKASDRIKAIDPPTWSFGLLGGAGFAAGSPSPVYRTGGGGALSANFSMGRDELDFEYFFQGLLGFDYLPGAGGSAAWNAASLALNFKISFPFLRWMRPYLSVGPGTFLNAANALEICGAVGAGMDLAISRPFHLQIGADFLGNMTSQIFHVGAGLIYRIME